MAKAAKINRRAIYRQWRAHGHTVSVAQTAARNAYVIGHARHDGRWMPVLSTDLDDEHKARRAA